jgi:hypothetical protein
MLPVICDTLKRRCLQLADKEGHKAGVLSWQKFHMRNFRFLNDKNSGNRYFENAVDLLFTLINNKRIIFFCYSKLIKHGNLL